MSTEQDIDDLLDEWEERLEAGERIEPSDLCRERPELLPQLLVKIRQLEAIDRRLDTVTGGPSAVAPSRRKGGEAELLRQDLNCPIKLSDLQFHASGGLGSVYVSQDHKLHREVAVKFMHRRLSGDPESRTRFLVEAEVTGRLEHPGIIPVHGWGEAEGNRLFYVMRFIRGENLDMALQRHHAESGNSSTLSLHQLLTSFVSVCNTIAYAHNCGIVHRDIKPENIMLGKYGETLVVDWGLALPVGRDERARSSGERTLIPSSGSQSGTASGKGAGTPGYMSPEQHAGAEVIGPASDIYSLGVTLYKILCGDIPFQAQHTNELKQKVIRGEFRKPSVTKPGIPPALEAICLKAMSVDPKDRYASALDLASDVERYLADEPVAANAVNPFVLV